jgi:hypothetical protein
MGRQVTKSHLSGGTNHFLGLVLFRLVAPPLQPGVVRLYLVRGAWFLRRLLLEGTSHI